jgi:uncharacterized membrane protein
MVAAIAAAGCGGGDDGEAPTSWDSLSDRPCPEDSFLTYESFGRGFMQNWCTGCHGAGLPEGMRQGAPVGIDFDTIEAVRAWDDRIWARAGDQNDTMPPVGGPPDEERALLGEWLACGAPTLGEM